MTWMSIGRMVIEAAVASLGPARCLVMVRGHFSKLVGVLQTSMLRVNIIHRFRLACGIPRGVLVIRYARLLDLPEQARLLSIRFDSRQFGLLSSSRVLPTLAASYDTWLDTSRLLISSEDLGYTTVRYFELTADLARSNSKLSHLDNFLSHWHRKRTTIDKYSS